MSDKMSEVEAVKKAVPDQYNAGNCGICNTPVFSMGGMIFHAHNIPPSADSHEATLLTPSSLTPAAVAGDAVKEISDTARLNWLADNEAHLYTHREKLGDGYGIWWNVVKRGKSISGHPLGSPRTAIDAAMQRKAAKESRKA